MTIEQLQKENEKLKEVLFAGAFVMKKQFTNMTLVLVCKNKPTILSMKPMT